MQSDSTGCDSSSLLAQTILAQAAHSFSVQHFFCSFRSHSRCVQVCALKNPRNVIAYQEQSPTAAGTKAPDRYEATRATRAGAGRQDLIPDISVNDFEKES